MSRADEPVREWLNPEAGSFDNVGSALLLLHRMSSRDGWVDVLFHVMDATAPGLAERRDSNDAAAAYILAWVGFGSYLALMLLLGAVLAALYRIRLTERRSALVTPSRASCARRRSRIIITASGV